MDHVRWLSRPVLRQPTMVCAFTGWNDAGDAASRGLRHLIEMWGATAVAEIDPEEFTDFATVRPHVKLNPRRERTIVWPTAGVWAASTPGGDVLLVLGPEPALRWRLFTEQLLGIAREYEVSLLVTLGSLLADVPHTRPVQIIGTATSQDTIDRFDLQRSRYEGPTGIVGVLQHAASQADIDSLSLWAAVPAYASQMPSPKASLALIERASAILGAPVNAGTLQREASDYDDRVTQLVEEDADLIGYVSRLESMSDDDEVGLFEIDDDDDGDDDDSIGGELGAESDEIDSEELLAEVEQFLRDQDTPGS